jgi:hypothetical protein
VRLKYVLPAVQMAFAIVCLRLTYLFDLTTRVQGSLSAQHPAFHILIYLNFPLMLVLKELMFGGLLQLSALIIAIGAFWYWIALLLEKYSQRRSIFPLKWGLGRMVADLVVITLGALLGGSLAKSYLDYPDSLVPTFSFRYPWSIPVLLSFLPWTIGPICVFGNDLIRGLRRTHRP